MTPPRISPLTLRLARADETGIVRRLADLDDAPTLKGEILLALVDGQAIAALSLTDGRVVADPFLPTAEAVALLTLRASQLSAIRARRWAGRTVRPRPRRTLRLRPAA
jgi:hypothetical protein